MSELRKDPITFRYVIIAPNRAERPNCFEYDVNANNIIECPFCEGREKSTPPEIFAYRDENSKANSPGWKVRVVPNKFPALILKEKLARKNIGMFEKMQGFGSHEVIIETPRHYKKLHQLSEEQIKLVIDTYQHRLTDLKTDERLKYILIFKNEGSKAGATINHSHSQLIATPVIPIAIAEELQGAIKYFNQNGCCIFCDIIENEKYFGERVFFENEYFICFCPYASRFPFEIWILPKKHNTDYKNISEIEKSYLAKTLKIVLNKLTQAAGNPDYNYIIHTGPNRAAHQSYWQAIDKAFHWHIEIIPRLTGMAGFEWGSNFFINPVPPENSAKRLRNTE